jgi:hypothetical protein
LVRRVLAVTPSRLKQLARLKHSASSSVSFAYELGDLPLEAGDSALKLVHAVTERSDLALDELLRAVAYPLIDLSSSLLERLTGESIVEHGLSSRTGGMGT